MLAIFTVFLIIAAIMETLYRSGKLEKMINFFGFKKSSEITPPLQQKLLLN